jgi:hypothetical protein
VCPFLEEAIRALKRDPTNPVLVKVESCGIALSSLKVLRMAAANVVLPIPLTPGRFRRRSSLRARPADEGSPGVTFVTRNPPSMPKARSDLESRTRMEFTTASQTWLTLPRPAPHG